MDSQNEEWPVSYHGTDLTGMKGIVESGYKIDFVVRDLWNFNEYRNYSTPLADIAESFASNVSVNGKYLKFIMQNRVNPNDRKVFFHKFKTY